MADPQLRIKDLPYLCQWIPRPQILTATFLQWMVQHFSSAANLEQNILGNKLYSASVRDSGILITTDKSFKPEELEKRPAIVIKRNAWSRLRLGIDNRMIGAVEPDGNTYYTNFWQGSHTLSCDAGEGAETEVLASEVMRELNGFAPVVRDAVRLHRLEILDIGEASKLEEASENYAVPITIAYAWEETWSVNKPSAALLNDMTLSLNF